MAERRMLSKVISVSKKVNLGVSDHFSRLLYTWLIPHTDDFGRMTGCPHKISALVIPMLDEDHNDVKRSLEKLHDAKLILWYEINGEPYLQIENFDKHQSGLHKRTKSKFPDPAVTNSAVPRISENFPNIPSELELNGTEQNGITTTAVEPTFETISEDIKPEPFAAAYVRVFQRDLTVFQAEQLGKYIDDENFEETVIVRAIERSGMKAGGISLVIKILNDYSAGGVKTLVGASEFDSEFEEKKSRGDPDRYKVQSSKKYKQIDELDAFIREEESRGNNRSSPIIQENQTTLC